jgi:ABC-type ATPase involved in cell division
MIAIEGVTKRYAGRPDPVLRGLDLRAAPGEVVLVSGETGAGKTTLLELCYAAGFADEGSVALFGRDVARLRRSSIALLRRRLGVVPQDLALLEERTALQNVALALEIRAVPRAELSVRAAAALGALDLAPLADTPVAELSMGQRQRVAIARAVVGEPMVLVADEPSAHLDAVGVEQLIDVLETLAARDASALLTSNDPRLWQAALRCGWRHLELRDGRFAAGDAAPDETELSDLDIEEAAPIEITAADAASEDPVAEDEAIPNVVPFPITARAGGRAE